MMMVHFLMIKRGENMPISPIYHHFMVFRFELTYYSCGGSECAMTVDTRHESITSSDKSGIEEAVSSSNSNIEKIIHTK